MSIVMTKKKSGSSTESSSGSTSDSSSSSTSSSGSDSSSSSDSESSTSQESTKENSGPDPPKKLATIQKNPRKSTENSKSKSADSKQAAKVKSQHVKSIKASGKGAIYSTDEEEDGNKKTAVKRKSNVKPKSSATITPKQVPTQKSNSNSKPAKTSATKTTGKNNKEHKSRQSQKSVAKNNDLNKKKSIFSPENSSESDSPKSTSRTQNKSGSQPKSKPEPRPKAAARIVEKTKPEKKTDKTPPKSKAIIETSASSGTSTTGTSSTSESETSADSSGNNRKAVKKPVKKPTVVQKETTGNTDSENESQEKSKQVTRKLTRSASTRKSRHVLGKNVYSDTDSDTESTKRSLSRSPVKKAPIVTKGKTTGKTKNKRNDAKNKGNEIVVTEERKCPLEGCDSNGHLTGKFDKHFTLEACPAYHNTTISRTKEELEERKKREEMRKKALEYHKKSPRPPATAEQKQFLQKIRDIRTKFKTEPPEDVKPCVDKTREPDLKNFVPEYDLKLFQDAQALASEKIEEDLKSLPSTKGTKYIEMGKFEMEVWYQSPYPEDYARLPKLYICEFCLRYMKSRTILKRHVDKCVWRHPPGEEVYRKDKISVWEVDGKRYKQYCQNLCLLAKFFLDHKTLYYDVEPFLFYVMTMVDNEGFHTVGYFSKEKNSFLNYNVSCILTLPPYQRQGYGRLLIDFSYLLTRVEGKIGSPEKPLSDLGLISYRSYWKDVLLGYLCSRAGTQLSVKDISQEMAIHSYDIVSTLQALGMMKYWKGKHIILKKQDVLDEYVERVKRRGSLLKEVDPSCLRWIPPQPASV